MAKKNKVGGKDAVVSFHTQVPILKQIHNSWDIHGESRQGYEDRCSCESAHNKIKQQDGREEPVLTVKTYKSNDYAHSVDISGPCRVVYSPDKPLSCGAKVWIETESEVKVMEY